MRKIRVLVIGQTPPPFHGQAIMIEKLVHARFDSIEIHHLRMSFSKSADEIGKFRWGKIIHLIRLLFHGTFLLLFRKIDALYYPPAGPNFVPVMRDIMLLPLWRVFAPKIIYHFRAGGVSEFLESKSRWLKICARAAYGKPDGAIALSRFNPNDGEYFRAKQIFVIPNGLEDNFDPALVLRERNQVRLFYAGLLNEEKGIQTLLEAFHLISERHNNVSLHLAGEFRSEAEKESFFKTADEYKIRDKIIFHGLLTGDAKWRLFAQTDIMCFLTHYPSETFGNSVLEAMIWELPVLGTRWRGVQDLIVDQETGFLVPIRDPAEAADRLELLVSDSELRVRMGKKGRQRFLQEFTLEKHLSRMESAILSTSTAQEFLPPANAIER